MSTLCKPLSVGLRNGELNSFNFVRKFIQEITFADIATADKNSISFQSHERIESNGLRKDPLWHKYEWNKKGFQHLSLC